MVSFLTIAVQVLSDPVQRMVYDDIHGYSLTSINPFLDDSAPKDHVFVDEFSCIGTFKSLLLIKMLLFMFLLSTLTKLSKSLQRHLRIAY